MQLIEIVAAEHPVKSVVILKSSKAEVVRTFKVALQTGQNKLVISQLPSTIDAQSIRITGLNFGGSSKTFLSDVVCSSSDESNDASKVKIQALEVQKTTLRHEKKVLDTQADVLVKYANSLTGEHASPEVMNNFLNAFADHGRSNIHAVAKIDAEIEAVDKQIEAEKKKASLVKGTANMELKAIINADADAKVDLKVTYIVNDTKWFPTYELHAVTGDDGQPSRTVSLHYRARITQSTGEDWTDAALTLSTTATDTIIKQVPKLNPVKVRVTYQNKSGFNQPPPPPQWAPAQPRGFATTTTFSFGNSAPSNSNTSLFGNTAPSLGGSLFGNTQATNPSSNAFGQAPAAATGGLFGQPASNVQPQTNLFGAAPAAPVAPSDPGAAAPQYDTELRQAEGAPLNDDEAESLEPPAEESDEPASLVTQTPMALAYAVRGKSSIPSDGKEHIVTIAVLPFEVDIDYVSVPRVDPRVYLQCQVKNNSEYRLLPGPVSIILDDSYVSKTTISDVNRNDVFNFTLGDDPSVIISYSRLSKNIKEGSGSFADTVNITTYTTSISVQNKHAFSIEKLLIRDAIPVCHDTRVRVILRKPKELIEAKEGVLVKVAKEKGQKRPGTVGLQDPEDEEEEAESLKVKWTKEKEGLYEYRWRVDPDDKINLQTVFEMKASTDLSCSFMENTPAPLFGQKY